MHWGMTQRERSEARRATEVWHPAFAWWPVRLVDGRWCWLERLERISYMANEIEVGAPHSLINAWCFRLPQEASQ